MILSFSLPSNLKNKHDDAGDNQQSTIYVTMTSHLQDESVFLKYINL